MKRVWTEEEDSSLRAAVEVFRSNWNWSSIAALFPGRSVDAVRQRCYSEGLVAEIPMSRRRSEVRAWTYEEDWMLSHLVHRHGTKWREVVKSLPGRTADAARSRYDRLQREEDGKTTCAHVSAQHLSCAPQSLDLLPSTAPSSVSSCSPGNMSPESSEGTSAEPHERTSPESSRTSTVLPSERDIHPVVVAQPILAA
eukprot:1271067-Prymnesium_polylepis.1